MRLRRRVFSSVRTRTILFQVTSKMTLQCVQVTDAPAAIVRPSVRPSENVRLTTLARTAGGGQQFIKLHVGPRFFMFFLLIF
jgi:hypothetical protein